LSNIRKVFISSDFLHDLINWVVYYPDFLLPLDVFVCLLLHDTSVAINQRGGPHITHTYLDDEGKIAHNDIRDENRKAWEEMLSSNVINFMYFQDELYRIYGMGVDPRLRDALDVLHPPPYLYAAFLGDCITAHDLQLPLEARRGVGYEHMISRLSRKDKFDWAQKSRLEFLRKCGVLLEPLISFKSPSLFSEYKELTRHEILYSTSLKLQEYYKGKHSPFLTISPERLATLLRRSELDEFRGFISAICEEAIGEYDLLIKAGRIEKKLNYRSKILDIALTILGIVTSPVPYLDLPKPLLSLFGKVLGKKYYVKRGIFEYYFFNRIEEEASMSLRSQRQDKRRA